MRREDVGLGMAGLMGWGGWGREGRGGKGHEWEGTDSGRLTMRRRAQWPAAVRARCPAGAGIAYSSGTPGSARWGSA